jgi:hypothetical protein
MIAGALTEPGETYKIESPRGGRNRKFMMDLRPKSVNGVGPTRKGGPTRSGDTARPIAFFDNLVGTIDASIASVPAPRREPTGWWPTLSARDLENANRLRPTVVWVGFGDIA